MLPNDSGISQELIFFLKDRLGLSDTSIFLDEYTLSNKEEDLIKEFIGVDISKQLQTSDFGGNLSDKQLKYCAQDVIFLHKIKSELESMLVRENRIDVFKKCLAFLDTRVELDQKGFKEDIFEH